MRYERPKSNSRIPGVTGETSSPSIVNVIAAAISGRARRQRAARSHRPQLPSEEAGKTRKMTPNSLAPSHRHVFDPLFFKKKNKNKTRTHRFELPVHRLQDGSFSLSSHLCVKIILIRAQNKGDGRQHPRDISQNKGDFNPKPLPGSQHPSWPLGRR